MKKGSTEGFLEHANCLSGPIEFTPKPFKLLMRDHKLPGRLFFGERGGDESFLDNEAGVRQGSYEQKSSSTSRQAWHVTAGISQLARHSVSLVRVSTFTFPLYLISHGFPSCIDETMTMAMDIQTRQCKHG